MFRKSDNRRHVLALSGGKDSAALAVYLKDRIPDLEYVFLDTGHELPETIEYLNRLRAILGIDITCKASPRPFEDWLKLKGYYLPSKQKRWCTEHLKIRVYEDYIGNDVINSYVGIRADEDRNGYISSKKNIIPYYPFIEDNLVISDIEELLEDSGLGMPSYYKWRSRSGCYFCFFQQRIEWINLLERHPDLFEKAKSFEKLDPKNGIRYTWREREALEELEERADEIKEEHERKLKNFKIKMNGRKLIDTLPKYEPCIICSV